MTNISTRGDAPELNFEQAATCGLAVDGGLYIPKSWPSLSHDEMRAMQSASYAETATRILNKLTDSSISDSELAELTRDAYSNFNHPDIAPLRELNGGIHLLELFHGPTLSFKDYALQFLGRFMDWSLSRHNQQLTIVGATSGDTGSAAINAIAGSKSISLYMLHPFERVSDMQRKQMTTNQNSNVFNYAVDGTFDDCQAIVKTIFRDREVKREHRLGAVNSINWGRIAAQVTYYFYAALRLGAPDVEVSFAVPTGNFGNVFAAYTARQMGLPIKEIIVCSNENDILTRFFGHGIMKTQGVKQTITPSMDIEISSNFERFLFELFDRDGKQVADLMRNLSQTGRFSVDNGMLEKARKSFSAQRVNDHEIRETIMRQHAETGTIVDPHTAVALAVAKRKADQNNTPMVVVSTAHPAKFSETIEQVIGTQVELPPQLAEIAQLPERYRRISNDPNELKKLMLPA